MTIFYILCASLSYTCVLPGRKDASDGTYAGMPSAMAAMTRVEDLGSGNYTLSYQVRTRRARDTTCCKQTMNPSAVVSF